MQNFLSLSEALIAHKKNHTTGITFVGGENEDFLSYGDLYIKSAILATELSKKGYRSGDIILVCLEDARDMMIAFWGCVLGRYIPALLPITGTPDNIQMLNTVYNSLDNANILTKSTIQDKIRDVFENPAISSISTLGFI